MAPSAAAVYGLTVRVAAFQIGSEDELAPADFQAVVSGLRSNPTFTSIVRDAERSLGRLLARGTSGGGAALPQPTPSPEGTRESPALSVAFGGGWQWIGARHDVLLSADVQLRLGPSPIYFVAFGQPSIGPPILGADGTPLLFDGTEKRPVLTTFGPGLVLRRPEGALRPELGAMLGLALNPAPAAPAGYSVVDGGPGLLVGPQVRGELGVQPGPSPVHVRVLVEGGALPQFLRCRRW